MVAKFGGVVEAEVDSGWLLEPSAGVVSAACRGGPKYPRQLFSLSSHPLLASSRPLLAPSLHSLTPSSPVQK